MTRRFITQKPVLVHDSPLSQDGTISLLLKKSRRSGDAVPIRRAFVQDTEPVKALITKPGPLCKLMRNEHALDLLLLLYAVTAGGDYAAVERSETWGRATGVSFEYTGAASSKVSRIWKTLEDSHLVSRSGAGRLVKVTKLLEDGSGNAYTRPSGAVDGPRKDVYFRLPFEYWHSGLYKQLDMNGKVMLLIAMSLRKKEFDLPQSRLFASYYGISESTMRRGIINLRQRRVLKEVRKETYETTETNTGWGERWIYKFNAPYDINVSNKKENDGKSSKKTGDLDQASSTAPADAKR